MNITPLAKLFVQRPKTVIIVFTIITVIIGAQATNIYMESDFATFLPKDDPTVQVWSEIDREFQVGYTIIIYVEADDIRDPDILKEMDRVSCNPKLNEFESDKGEQDGVYSVKSLAYYIKEENAKPYVIGGLGGTGKNEIPDDELHMCLFIAQNPLLILSGMLYENWEKRGFVLNYSLI